MLVSMVNRRAAFCWRSHQARAAALLWLPRRLPTHRTVAALQVSTSLPQETNRKPPPPPQGVHEGPFSKLRDDGAGKQTRQTDFPLLKEPSRQQDELEGRVEEGVLCGGGIYQKEPWDGGVWAGERQKKLS